MSDIVETNTDKHNDAIATDFLNPNSMLTPGFAGGVTMMITNALCAIFVIPVALTGLAISALFGTLVIATTGSWLQKGVYYVLNSLIIFCVAMGSGNLANQIERRPGTNGAALSLVSPAHAQVAIGGETKSGLYLQELEKITADQSLSNDQKMKKIETFNQNWRARQLPNSNSGQENGVFFKSWSIIK